MLLMTLASTVIPTGIVNEMIDVTKSVLSLFTVFPINILIGAMIIGIGFKIFKNAKSAAGTGKN